MAIIPKSLCILVFFGALLRAQVAEKELVLSAYLAQDMLSRTAAVDNPSVTGYIDRVGSELAAQINSGLHWRFAVRQTPVGLTPEPLWLPDGYIFLSLDLIAAAQSEAEVAGRLAHAMGHAVQRHHGQNAVATIPLILLSENPRVLPSKIREEFEADLVAVRTMSGAGYDPAAFAGYIRRTRPERAANLDEAVAALPPRTYAEGGDFSSVQAIARQMLGLTPTKVPSLFRGTR